MTSQEKTKFRKTSKWRNWRKYLLEKRDYTCEISGLIYKKGMQVHHLDPDQYDTLKEDKFVVLTRAEHRNLERLLRIKNLDIDKYCERLRRVYLESK